MNSDSTNHKADLPSGTAEAEAAHAEQRGRDAEAATYEAEQIRNKGASYYRMHARILRRALNGIGDGPLLDAGCGTGLVTRELVGNGRRIAALDFSTESLKLLTAKHLDGVIAAAGSVTSLPLVGGSFSAAVCALVLQHIPPGQRSIAWEELYRCLRPGGRLVVTAYNNAEFTWRNAPIEGVYPSGIPYYSFACEDLLREAEAAGFRRATVRPIGAALHLRHRRMGWRFYQSLHPILNAAEARLHGCLPANRQWPSSYWILTAMRPPA
ncbi:MAG: class I SAM-dependent methyltransferase [Armatimonadetes bacterium]|nr:class I SAM-dependent methyltransferase [Armatimonadota bacterium]MDE2205859.1 class I SAM-dependent methyltransferase [Armatimonadota bacterium]